ncbi:hypothetical protein V7S43_014289 [Phytophthora oleae]|uniref:Uncharacterized protein n=1 Tax=Phytophthora oleae TaxID=2107226 RepID=A0ABD3F4X1_9STRA
MELTNVEVLTVPPFVVVEAEMASVLVDTAMQCVTARARGTHDASSLVVSG